MTAISTAYDDIARDYSAAGIVPPAAVIREIVRLAHITERSRVIDLGCGDGTITKLIAEHCGQIIGLDKSEEFIRIAKQKNGHPRAQWLCTDVLHANVRPPADVLFSFESFHLFPSSPQLVTVLRRLCVPRGRLAIGWSCYSWEDRLSTVAYKIYSDFQIPFQPWGFQRLDEANIKLQLDQAFGRGRLVKFEAENTYDISAIALYLSSLSFMADVPDAQRRSVRLAMEKQFTEQLNNSSFTGWDTYYFSVWN